jgi:hypothetical protein
MFLVDRFSSYFLFFFLFLCYFLYINYISMSDTKNLINVIIFYAKITKHEFEISNIFSYFGQ